MARALKHHSLRTDLACVLGAGLLTLAAAIYGDWSEHLTAFAKSHEPWQLDEWPLVILVLALGAAWAAWRQATLARHALAATRVADAQNLALLAHNRDLTQQLLHTQEAERRALARELHDEVAQNCVAIRAEANFIAHSGDAAQANHDSANTNTHTTAAAASAHRITQAAENLHRIVRRLLTRLRPEVLDSLGLTAAIQDLCETWETQTGIACSFVPSLGQQGVDTAPPLSDDCTITLYRAVQEALSNAARHAQANHVHITLQWSPSQIELTIEDNGIGLPAPHHQPTQGFGLLGMRERVASLQGSLQLLPVASGGLRIEVRLPVNL